MGKKTIKIDKNAHIDELTSNVLQSDNKLIANIAFTNNSGQEITAIKFTAKGFNSFGDTVSVNGKESFLLIIQDIHIKQSERATDLKVFLPVSDIRSLELVENQICLANDDVLTYEGADFIDVEVELLDETAKAAVHTLVDNRLEYIPQELEDGAWICGCGKYNKEGEGICESCHTTKECLFGSFSAEGMKQLITEKKRIDDEKQRQLEEAIQKKQKKAKIITASIVVAIILIIILSIPISHQIELSKRTIFQSEEEMKEAIQGTFTHYHESEITGRYANEQLKINGNKITISYCWDNIEDSEVTISSYDPEEGTFSAIYNFIVTKEGNLKRGDDLFELGGYMTKMSTSSSSSSYSSYESKYTALKISDVSVDTSYSYTHCSGTITNNGKKTYDYVKVKGVFKDSVGNIVDTDWTYAVSSEGLEPGESKKFELSVKSDVEITDCSVSIISD